jgi:hypothetical protein
MNHDASLMSSQHRVALWRLPTSVVVTFKSGFIKGLGAK